MSLEETSPARLDFRAKTRSRWMLCRLWSLFRSAAVVYLLLVLAMMLFENQLIFPAPSDQRGDWNPQGLGQQDVYFESEDRTRLHGWLVEHPRPQVYVLFCHGNAEHVADLADLLYKYRHDFQATVFAFDYRGYGRSEGKPDEHGVLADAHAAQIWFAKHLDLQPSEIVIVGRSVGGAVAVDLASKNGALGLVLERTFASLPEVAASHFPWLPVKLLMRSRFDSISKIEAYHGPLLQSHGTDDEVVPFESGKRLFDAAPGEDKKFLVEQEGTHNEPYRQEYWRELSGFMSRLSAEQM